jgi:hypothetical protein
MPLVPAKKDQKVAFYRSKIEPWTTNAVAIGTTTTAVGALDTLVTAAETAIADQIAKLAAYRTAVETADAAVEAMGVAGADIISAIRTKGRTGGQAVYDLAQIPAPATPTPIGNPGTPEALKVELHPDGSIKLTWKCANPAGSTGTLYHVFRSMGNPNSYGFIGGTGSREFTDATVPSGSSVVYYKIQAIRTTAIGVAGEFMVRFGIGGSVEVTAIGPTAPKLAA